MQNNSDEHTEDRLIEEPWSEMLEIVSKQLEANNRLIQIITPLAETPPQNEAAGPDKETTDTLTELIVEVEALQARLRTCYHNLYPDVELYEPICETTDEDE